MTQLLLEPLNEEAIERALRDIEYSRVKLKDDVKELRLWLEEQHHLPLARLNEKDCFLEMFLTGNKGNMEKTKCKIDSYYSYRSKSDIYSDRDPLSSENRVVSESYYTILPQSTKEGYRIVLSSINPDASHFNLAAHIRKLATLIDHQLRMDSFSIGHYFIMDATNMALRFLLKMNPLIIRDTIHLAQEILPIRVKGVFLINAPYFVEKAVNNLILPFMAKKLRNRVHITSDNTQELIKYIDRKILPKNYGGDELTLQKLNDIWKLKDIAEREWLINELSEPADETKRIRIINDTKTNSGGISSNLMKFFQNVIPERRWKK